MRKPFRLSKTPLIAVALMTVFALAPIVATPVQAAENKAGIFDSKINLAGAAVDAVGGSTLVGILPNHVAYKNGYDGQANSAAIGIGAGGGALTSAVSCVVEDCKHPVPRVLVGGGFGGLGGFASASIHGRSGARVVASGFIGAGTMVLADIVTAVVFDP